MVGVDVVSMDVYVVSDFVECFVVLFEYFFSVFELLENCFLLVYWYFCIFYCQDLLVRLKWWENES